MITGDIGAEIARLLRAGASAGELPDEAAGVSAAGTWRPAPVASGGGPGIYATSVPLALAAGAEFLFVHMQRERPPASIMQAGSDQEPVGPVARAVAYYGSDAVRYALARTPMPGAGAVVRQLGLPLDLANPFVAVR